MSFPDYTETYKYVLIYLGFVVLCIALGFCLGEKKYKNTIIVNRVCVRPKEGFNSIPKAWGAL